MLSDCDKEPRGIEEVCNGERRFSGTLWNDFGNPYEVEYCALVPGVKNGCSFQAEFPEKINGLYRCEKLGEGNSC